MHDYTQEIEEEFKRLTEESSCSLLKIKPGWEWQLTGKALGEAIKLYFEFWFEHEISLLFADTGAGKSILAVQIAKELSEKGIKVLLLDFELSARQFFQRYSGVTFSNNLLRAEIDPDALPPDDFEYVLIENIKEAIRQHKAEVLIVDNLTFLRTETEKAKDALPLMKIIKQLTRELNISTLLLGHTPKRDLSRPITNNDLAGSKMLMNFVDSAFAIGKSASDSGLRYLKQIKVRSAEMKYDAGNVVTMELVNDGGFLRFEFKSFDDEQTHLKEAREDEIKARNEQIVSLAHEGYSTREIGEKFGISHTQVARILSKANK